LDSSMPEHKNQDLLEIPFAVNTMSYDRRMFNK
jgi:hypothetical protein